MIFGGGGGGGGGMQTKSGASVAVVTTTTTNCKNGISELGGGGATTAMEVEEEVAAFEHRHQRVPLVQVNPYLLCGLCKGYLIDATTIVDCLHAFCRSCILTYLKTSRYCPICDVQVHKNRPLLNIRPDPMLQVLVYKLVPRLLYNEITRRRDFLLHGTPSSSLDVQQQQRIPTAQLSQYLWHDLHAICQYVMTSDEAISLILRYCDNDSDDINTTTFDTNNRHMTVGQQRYLRCPAAVTIAHLQKLLRAKYDLCQQRHLVDILLNGRSLSGRLTLLDVAYMSSWKRKKPLDLSYRILECKRSRIQPIKTNDDESSDCGGSNNNDCWKEIQLRISENGEMSITGVVTATVDTTTVVQSDSTTSTVVTSKTTVNCVKRSRQHTTLKGVNRNDSSSDTTKPVPLKSNVDNTTNIEKNHQNNKTKDVTEKKGIKRKLGTPALAAASSSLLDGATTTTTTTTTTISSGGGKKPVTAPITKKSPPPQIQLPAIEVPSTSYAPQTPIIIVPKPPPLPTPIASPNVTTDGPSTKPVKSRLNQPRYLGAPASGVKPMYPPPPPSPPPTTSTTKIQKIDPKTLKPITTTTASITETDLKITTASSVPIFKSKTTSTSTTTSTTTLTTTSTSSTSALTTSQQVSKRDLKLSLNFTPPNPFIPNLNPLNFPPHHHTPIHPHHPHHHHHHPPTHLHPHHHQFLYPPPLLPPGYPTYDPRFMATYHNLLYGQQRLPFSRGLPLPPSPPLGASSSSSSTSTTVIPVLPKKKTEPRGAILVEEGGFLKPPPPPPLLTIAKHRQQNSSSTVVTTTSSSAACGQVNNNSNSKKSLEDAVEKLAQINREKELNNNNSSVGVVKVTVSNSASVTTTTTTQTTSSGGGNEKKKTQLLPQDSSGGGGGGGNDKKQKKTAICGTTMTSSTDNDKNDTVDSGEQPVITTTSSE